MRIALLALLTLLAACGDDPDARKTSGENEVTARAVADVDAAMDDARAAKPLAQPPVEAPAETK